MKYFLILPLFITLITVTQAKTKIGVFSQCPYLCEGKENKGYILQILNEALGKSNFTLSFVPYYRVAYGLMAGEFDLGILSSLDILDKPDLHRTSPSLGFHYIGKISKDGTLLKKPLIKLKNHSFILPRNSASEILEKKAIEVNPDWKTNTIQYLVGKDVPTRTIKMIKLGRGDIGIGDFNSLSYLISKEGLKKEIQIKASSLAGFTPYILVKKGDRDNKIYQKIQSWLDKNRENGRLEKLLKEYNISDWDLYDTRKSYSDK